MTEILFEYEDPDSSCLGKGKGKKGSKSYTPQWHQPYFGKGTKGKDQQPFAGKAKGKSKKGKANMTEYRVSIKMQTLNFRSSCEGCVHAHVSIPARKEVLKFNLLFSLDGRQSRRRVDGPGVSNLLSRLAEELEEGTLAGIHGDPADLLRCFGSAPRSIQRYCSKSSRKRYRPPPMSSHDGVLSWHTHQRKEVTAAFR